MLLPRFLTAVVGLPLLMASIYFGGLPFFFIVLGITLLGLREFYFLAEESGYPCYKQWGLVLGGLVFISVFLNGLSFGQVTENQLTSGLIALSLVMIVMKSLWRGPADTSLSEWAVTFFGIFYVAWSLSHLLLIRDLRPQGQYATFLLFSIIWASDTVAYWVGVRWGKRRIAEAISPKKTWEGTTAGLVAAMVVSALFQMTLLRQVLHLPEALILGAVTGFIAFASDLGESLLKRGAGVKDSSPLLPGHGGILDRFDSFLLTAPLYYYYWAFFKH
jgi:phosphatidate cytidylyltransferase